MQKFSLDSDTIGKIFQLAKPLGHNEKPDNSNLGFGFLYYGMVRAVQPEHVLVIGSGYGFSVVCLALGLKDNGRGRLSFVDPSYDVLRHGPFKTVGGRGKWNDPQEVVRHFENFDVHRVVTHYKMRSDEFFPRFRTLGLPTIDVAFIDGNHSYGHVKFDFVEALGHMRKNSYIFLHDTNLYIRELLRNSGVKRWLGLVKKEKELFEIVDFPFSSGVALIRILQDDAWKYLISSCLQ